MVYPLEKSQLPKEPGEDTHEFDYHKSNYDLYLLLLCDFILFYIKICDLLCSELTLTIKIVVFIISGMYIYYARRRKCTDNPRSNEQTNTLWK